MKNTNSIEFKYEVKDFARFKSLKDLRKHIIQYGASTRSVIAAIVIGHGFKAHTGGRHVAVLSSTGNRLAIITSKTHPDFN